VSSSRRVGLVGFACDTGLGNAASAFAEHLPFARRLVLDHPKFGINPARLDDHCTVGRIDMPAADVDAWLDGLDAVFAIQSGYAPDLWQRAKVRGILTVLMPNAEWFAPQHPDIALIDRFIAPTTSCMEMLVEAGFGERTVFIPHAIDTRRFAGRRRTLAERFLHIRGWDDADRKGTTFVLAAARRLPEIPFTIRTQMVIHGDIPPNVRLLGEVADPAELYTEGDVAIQPSRYEGVGLPILEAMASGLPTLVPDVPPMNKFPASRELIVAATRTTRSLVGHPFPAGEVDVDDLVRRILSIHGQPIGELSDASRRRMEERSWDRLRPDYLDALGFDGTGSGFTPF
jgi:glycosyltransferase involved in cell wall biosynthesis